ncbi:MAG: hypothetical protein JNK74_18105 [Candidatus Hydrogenedentes bacterium]|nr:hypothetical protein [Candidatus Hydrogenedentota bacterium]
MRLTARVPDVGQRVFVNSVLFPKRDFMAILNYLVKLVTRTFMPELSRNMESEGTFNFNDPQSAQGDVDLSRYIQVEDNGSDVTIVSFAGMAVLFAGMPQFEFRNMLKEDRNNYNLVFLRDPYRTGYFRQPDGGGDGADFYPELVNQTLARLGSTYNVAIGASAGGYVAFYVSSRAKIDQIVAFSPCFPPEVYLGLKNQLKVYFNLPQLLRSPADFAEVFLVTVAAQLVWRKMRGYLAGKTLPDVTRLYLDTQPAPPRATIFYGERSVPDADQARRHIGVGNITVKPLDTGRHNCAAFLKKRGLLGKTILAEIDAGLAARKAALQSANQEMAEPSK